MADFPTNSDQGSSSTPANSGGEAPAPLPSASAFMDGDNGQKVLNPEEMEAFLSGDYSDDAKPRREAPVDQGQGDGSEGREAAPATQPQPQAQPQPTGQSQPQPGTPTGQQPPPVDPAFLQREMDKYQAILRSNGIDPATGQRLAVQQQPVHQQQAPTQGGGEAADPWGYDVEVPDTLVQGLMSVKPEEVKGAVAALGNSLAQLVSNTVFQQVQQFVPRVVQHQSQAMAVQQQVYQDFYGSNPQWNRPELRPVITGVFQRMMQEGVTPAWTPEVKNELTRRVQLTLSAALPQTGQPGGFSGNGGTPLAAPGTRPAQDTRSVQERALDDLFSGLH